MDCNDWLIKRDRSSTCFRFLRFRCLKLNLGDLNWARNAPGRSQVSFQFQTRDIDSIIYLHTQRNLFRRLYSSPRHFAISTRQYSGIPVIYRQFSSSRFKPQKLQHREYIVKLKEKCSAVIRVKRITRANVYIGVNIGTV